MIRLSKMVHEGLFGANPFECEGPSLLCNSIDAVINLDNFAYPSGPPRNNALRIVIGTTPAMVAGVITEALPVGTFNSIFAVLATLRLPGGVPGTIQAAATSLVLLTFTGIATDTSAYDWVAFGI